MPGCEVRALRGTELTAEQRTSAQRIEQARAKGSRRSGSLELECLIRTRLYLWSTRFSAGG